MKKTVSVNIRGLNFIIEEDAYELLQNYLDRLNAALKHESGSREILEDVELRIAEICSSKLTESKTVIELKDIQEITAKLGDPSEYVDTESEESSNSEKNYSQESSNKKPEKRLFRDTDNAAIAGVCSGIANFFGIDVVIIRAIFVVMFLFGGFGFPIYIILWIIVPKAKSSIDRLRMKGKPITVDTVREEVETAASNLEKGSKKFAQAIRQDDTYSRSISRAGRIIASIIGIGCFFAGVAFLIPFLVFIIGGFDFIPVQNQDGFMSFPEFGTLVLTDGNDYNMMWIGGLVLGFSIATFLILLGSILIFRIRNRWAKLSLIFIFTAGFTGGILCMSAGTSTAKDFYKDGELKEKVADIQSDTLFLEPVLLKLKSDSNKEIISSNDFGMIEVTGEDVRLYGIDFEYHTSNDSLFHVYRVSSARGESHKVANQRADNIKHSIDVQDNKLSVHTDYSFPKKDKLRDQQVYLIIEVPTNGKIMFRNHEVDVRQNGYEIEGYLDGDGEYEDD